MSLTAFCSSFVNEIIPPRRLGSLSYDFGPVGGWSLLDGPASEAAAEATNAGEQSASFLPDDSAAGYPGGIYVPLPSFPHGMFGLMALRDR